MSDDRSKPKASVKLADLKPAPYNPRQIAKEAFAGLTRSLGEFGDISGLVWNRRTGHLVAGHQRLDALKREHGDKLAMRANKIVTPSGEKFRVRIVDWPEDKEKASNVAANNPKIAGTFDRNALDTVLNDLAQTDWNKVFGDLRLDELWSSRAHLKDVADEDEEIGESY